MVISQISCSTWPRKMTSRARVFDWVTGAAGHFGPHRLIRRMISDHAAARASVKKILLWDVDGYHRHPR
jgi:hypothetical protein